jgi:hypothetical protein
MTSTDLTGALQSLHDHGYMFTVRGAEEGYKFSAARKDGAGIGRRIETLEEIVPLVAQVLAGSAPVEPSTATQSLHAALSSIGAPSRFFAINGDGDTVVWGPERQAAVFKQRAAAFRRGAESGAVAVWDASTGKVESL